MSYDIHITKANHWTSSNQNPITDSDIELIGPDVKLLPFIYVSGRLTLCRADERVIGLLVEIARKIGARVQGDDGELYENSYFDSRIIEEIRTHNKMISNSDEDTKELNDYIESLSVGAILLHRKYGQGTVKEIIGEGTDKELIILFSTINKTKRILAYHSPIIKNDNNF